MAKVTHPIEELSPEQQKITKIQAKRIGALANVNPTELERLTIAQASERLKWKIDPALFLFRRICGKVVKKDPVTGTEYPVPFATVHVEDTDCHLVSYFPNPWPWGWFFPFNCHREVIGTTKTDRCGNFCVWVPRFDIDWILEWRRLRLCFPFIFRRPSIIDLLPKLKPEVVGPRPPFPGPDPGPLDTLTTLPPSVIEAISGGAAGRLAQRAALAQTARSFGTPSRETEPLLTARAFETELPPPLPAEFHQARAGQGSVVAAKGASAAEGIRSAIAMKIGLDPAAKEFASFDARRFIGPFFRCFDIFIPEWHLILDVPDITFRVTQDTNGDGVEESIYSEGYFDVRWDAGPLPDVKLVASAIAKETHVCETPVVPCGNVPAILFAGLMPLTDPNYFDASIVNTTGEYEGFALRPNRPSTAVSNPPCPSGPNPPRTPARTPFCHTLQLYGCVHVQAAKYYRVLQSVDHGATFSAITGLSWNLYPIPSGPPLTVAADSSGWYPVLPNPNAFHPGNLVLEWPTPALGQSVLRVEIADAGKNHIAYSADVAIQVDNTAPDIVPTRLAWKFATEPDSAFSLPGRDLLVPCPTIHRGATPRDIVVVYEATVMANHLRDACIGTSGCGDGAFVLESGNVGHWHTSPGDNSAFLHGRYFLSSSAHEGAYSFGRTANSRAMNPAGADGGHLLPKDWFYESVYVHTIQSIGVAVVNEN